ncbi:hypothetical protein Tco_1430411 [Tanacetum coccineum]
MTILTLLMHLKSHSSSIRTPVKILHKVLHILTTIVVTGVVIHLTVSFVNDVLVSLVGTVLIMAIIVHRKFRLSLIRNRATMKTLMSSHKLCQASNNNIFVVKIAGALMRPSNVNQ